MSEIHTMISPTVGQFSTRTSAAAELETVRAIFDELKIDPAKLLEVAVKAGIYTPEDAPKSRILFRNSPKMV